MLQLQPCRCDATGTSRMGIRRDLGSERRGEGERVPSTHRHRKHPLLRGAGSVADGAGGSVGAARVPESCLYRFSTGGGHVLRSVRSTPGVGPDRCRSRDELSEARLRRSSTRTVGRNVAALIALVLLVSSCTEAADEPKDTVPRGGTLIVNAFVSETTLFSLDPHIAFAAQPWELFRCCLLRTLLAYPGRPTGDGGARLSPDLAESLPEVSTDGLTWTFRLRRGLRYGPPFTDTEILAPDIVRALERAASRWEAGGYLYEPIEGFTDVTDGKAESISGLETPDDHTLVIHLTHVSGDIGQLMALPASAPIPPVPNGVEFGAADGHEDYGPFLVSSGPYMFDGAADLEFTSSPEEQTPARGYQPDGPLTLVRNPSWRPGSDRLRPAYPDRIEARFVESIKAAAEGVARGEADVVLV